MFLLLLIVFARVLGLALVFCSLSKFLFFVRVIASLIGSFVLFVVRCSLFVVSVRCPWFVFMFFASVIVLARYRLFVFLFVSVVLFLSCGFVIVIVLVL